MRAGFRSGARADSLGAVNNVPFAIKFPVALVVTILIALVLYIGAVVQVYVLAWLLGVIGQIF